MPGQMRITPHEYHIAGSDIRCFRSLRHHGDTSGSGLCAQAGKGKPLKQNFSMQGEHFSAQTTEQGTFSAAIGTDQRGDFSARQRNVNIFQYGSASIAGVKGLYGQQEMPAFHRRSPRPELRRKAKNGPPMRDVMTPTGSSMASGQDAASRNICPKKKETAREPCRKHQRAMPLAVRRRRIWGATALQSR